MCPTQDTALCHVTNYLIQEHSVSLQEYSFCHLEQPFYLFKYLFIYFFAQAKMSKFEYYTKQL